MYANLDEDGFDDEGLTDVVRVLLSTTKQRVIPSSQQHGAGKVASSWFSGQEVEVRSMMGPTTHNNPPQTATTLRKAALMSAPPIRHYELDSDDGDFTPRRRSPSAAHSSPTLLPSASTTTSPLKHSNVSKKESNVDVGRESSSRADPATYSLSAQKPKMRLESINAISTRYIQSAPDTTPSTGKDEPTGYVDRRKMLYELMGYEERNIPCNQIRVPKQESPDRPNNGACWSPLKTASPRPQALSSLLRYKPSYRQAKSSAREVSSDPLSPHIREVTFRDRALLGGGLLGATSADGTRASASPQKAALQTYLAHLVAEDDFTFQKMIVYGCVHYFYHSKLLRRNGNS